MKVNIKNYKSLQIKKDTILIDIASLVQEKFKYDILIGRNHNGLIELNESINEDMDLEFFDLTSKSGNKIYERGIVYLLIEAIRLASESTIDAEIKYSINKGIMFKLNKKITKDILNKIENNIQNMIKKNILFEKISTTRIEAINYFNSNNKSNSSKLLSYLEDKYITLYKLNNQYDYFNGPLPYSTKVLKYYNISLLNSDEIILTIPNIYNDEVTSLFDKVPIFYESITKYEQWAKRFNITSISDLNDNIINNKINEIITLSEYYADSNLMEIAKNIVTNKNEIKVILIGGASSSGKTTTTKKLELYLKTMGLNPYSISLDDYFIDREKMSLIDGKYDFESIDALDLDLFNKQINDLLKGKEVLIPEFDFLLGKKSFKRTLKLKEKDIILIEGLHALNKKLSKCINEDNKYKIYLSPSTYMNVDNYNRINMTDIRLLRRIVRDNATRGFNVSRTLEIWDSVRLGEEKYVFPFQDEADVIYSTALLYELAVLKVYAEPLLYSVNHNDLYYPEARRLIGFLKSILPIPSDNIPEDSIIREFIGGSIFYK